MSDKTTITVGDNNFTDQRLDPVTNPEASVTNVTNATALQLDSNGNLIQNPQGDGTNFNLIQGTDGNGGKVSDVNVTGSTVVADLTLAQGPDNNIDQCNAAIEIMNRITNLKSNVNIGNLSDYEELFAKINQYTEENHNVALNIPEVQKLKDFSNNISNLGTLFNSLQIHINNSQNLDASLVITDITDSLTKIYNAIMAIENFKIAISETTKVSVPKCLVDVTAKLVDVNAKIGSFMDNIDYFTADPTTTTEEQKQKYGLTEQSKEDLIKVQKAMDFLDELYSQGASIAFKNDGTITSLVDQLNKFSDPTLNNRITTNITKFRNIMNKYPNIRLRRDSN
jgi:hypothetical protein